MGISKEQQERYLIVAAWHLRRAVESLKAAEMPVTAARTEQTAEIFEELLKRAESAGAAPSSKTRRK